MSCSDGEDSYGGDEANAAVPGDGRCTGPSPNSIRAPHSLSVPLMPLSVAVSAAADGVVRKHQQGDRGD